MRNGFLKITKDGNANKNAKPSNAEKRSVMRTVIYFEVIRRRKKFLAMVLAPVVVWSVLYLIFGILDRKAPFINKEYMMWPEIVKNLLGLPAWRSEFSMNIWHILALFYPLLWGYLLMEGTASSVVEEERLETVVYIQNAGIPRRSVWLGKGLTWAVVSFLSLLIILLVQMLEMWFSGMTQNVGIISRYYGLLSLVSLFYLVLGLFLASYKKDETGCKNMSLVLVLVPWMVSRIPAVLHFISALLVETGRQGRGAELLEAWGTKLDPLTMVCPLTWCWHTMRVSGSFVAAAVVIAILLGGVGFSLYQTRRC